MGVTVKTKINKIPQIEKAVKSLDGKFIEVGIFNGRSAWLAGIHEYGMDIDVTPKMRAFLHNMGVHLKKTTTKIVIPERSFIRSGHDENIVEILEVAGEMTSAVLEGKLSLETMLHRVGDDLANAIKEYAINLSDPSDSDLTINGSEDDWGLQGLPGKGSSNPLVDTGQMIGDIEYRVK